MWPLLILPIIGVWVMVAHAAGPVSRISGWRAWRAKRAWNSTSATLPRMPSGRIERDAADALFATVRDELETDPDNWRALVPTGTRVRLCR